MSVNLALQGIFLMRRPDYALFIFKIISFLFGCAGSSWLHRLSLVVASGGSSLVGLGGFLIVVGALVEHRL